MEKEYWEKLHSPENEFRSAPFWAFNSKLKEKELRFQIRSMKEQGIGGFFIHSREGLETPYLSNEWMDAVKVSMDEAKKQGMEVWIYDEDKWPSGSAGGLVSQKNPEEYSSKGLTLETLTIDEAIERKACGRMEIGQEYIDGKILGIYTVSENNECINELLQGIHTEKEDAKILVLRREISKNSEWYNGFAPSDTLNPSAVEEFLNLTHEAYKNKFHENFGDTIKGFFTDEPNCCDFYSVFTKGRPWVTWTDGFDSYFKTKRGYDLIEYLPYLFYHGEKDSKVRHDYWYTIAELFQESYMKQVYEWCEKEGVESIGHILYENDLGYQARVCGAAMPQYAYLHRPGIDLLGEQTEEYLTVKQCTSVARQYGRKHTITETYGCTGWEFGFEGQKWLGDWQFVMGIDRRCQHLAQYSITGCRKRDYPPVFNYQTTWWKYNYLLEDYFARISMMMGEGETLCDVLVIHPMSSIWTRCGSSEKENLDNIEMNMGWTDEHITSLNEWGDIWNRMSKILLGAHIDFDFGDEILLKQNGSVEKGALVVGECKYHTVIVPGILSMFENTKRLLEEFSKTGGKVILVKPLPDMIEGEMVSELRNDLANLSGSVIVEKFENISEYLYRNSDECVRIRNRDGQEASDILVKIKRQDHNYVFFMVNNDRKEEQTVTIEFFKTGKVLQYDPWLDKHSELTVKECVNGSMRFIASFTPAQSLIFIINTDEKPDVGNVEFPYEHPHYTEPVLAALGPAAKIRRTMENVLTLDTCRYRLNNEEMSAVMEVWKAQKEIREKLNMQQIYYNGAPQRYFWLNIPCEKDGVFFELEFEFDVKNVPVNDCYVVIEKAGNFTVKLNSEPCIIEDDYFIDHEMNRFRLPEMNRGRQKLSISGKYNQAMELEDIYIIGDFAVDTDRCICSENEKIHFGDWCLQGYYHYPGSIVYEFEFLYNENSDKKKMLKMGDYKATLGVVRLNGKVTGYLMGNTVDSIELTEYIQKGNNHLEIEIIGSPRNMFGPFHQAYTGCSRISWADFRTEGKFYTNDYVLEPYGIFGQITIV